MIRVREQRLWTALMVIGLCAYAIGDAAPTMRLGLASLWANSRTVASDLKPLMSEEPIGPLARRLALALAPPVDPAARSAALTTLLGATPLSGGAWLDLAMARERAGAPLRDVASALALSSLTAPNEAWVMGGRAVFGLPLWAKLPPDVRRGLIGDLIGGWSEIDDARRKDLDSLLTVETDQTREEIRAALLLAGEPAAPILSALDLTPNAAPPEADDAE
jgi:hypothetical protein